MGNLIAAATSILVASMMVAKAEALPPQGASFYVDSARLMSGNGSETAPWTSWTEINWAQVNRRMAEGNVAIYFSSRSSWTSPAVFTCRASGVDASHQLEIVGDEQYNSERSGRAKWQHEKQGGRALINAANGRGCSIHLGSGTHYVTVKGFYLKNPPWDGILLGENNPTTNMSHISILDIVVDSPAHNHGIWFGYAEKDCHDLLVSGCIISNTPTESIYIGHYSYLGPTITNVIVESNLIVNCGLSGEGDGPDIKPGVAGAVIRYNTHIRTRRGLGGSACGTVIASDNCQIYGNAYFNLQDKTDMAQPEAGWGYGIYVNADGDGKGNGEPITRCLIYNNLICDNMRSGIKLTANTPSPGCSLTGVRICNNTIWGNSQFGIEVSASAPQQVVIAELRNNLIGQSGSNDLFVSDHGTILAADNNEFWRPPGSGDSWFYHHPAGTMAQWQALGFDRAGIFAEPVFVGIANSDFLHRDYMIRQSGARPRGMTNITQPLDRPMKINTSQSLPIHE
jgi:hypothetical protein